MTKRPGFHTSEFIVALVAVLGCVVSASQDYISTGHAFQGSIGAAVAFIVSRGLAKYEARGTTAPPPG